MELKRLPTWENVKHAWKNKSGSEALEMVYSTGALCIIILCTIGILSYALQMNAVSHATKRIARYVEVSGIADKVELQSLLEDILPNADKINAEVDVTNVSDWYSVSEKKIQLRETFTVIVDADYSITLATAGTGQPFDVPFRIHVAVDGQSEVYWKN